MIRILVTGSNGQLGSEFKYLSPDLGTIEFVFTDIEELDITSKEAVTSYFQDNKFNFCINCAAYTAVDKAEEDRASAKLVNETAVVILAEVTKKFDVKFIHISTDFVFSGSKNTPYLELDSPDPINFYGKSKLKGESLALAINRKSVVIRTSWLYSSFGNNFVKTMLKLSETKDELGVIIDQVGTPTYARDLAEVVLKVIQSDKFISGVYHYSNEGVASWYDFAQAIFDENNINIKVNPIPTEQYPTPAKRPVFSVMNKTKIKETFGIEIPHWRKSLSKCLEII